MHGWAFDSSCPSSLMWPPFSKISATKVAATGPNDKVNFSYLFSVKVKWKILYWCCVSVNLTIFSSLFTFLKSARQFQAEQWEMSSVRRIKTKAEKLIRFLFVLQPSGPVTRRSANTDQRQAQTNPESRFGTRLSAKTAKRTTNRSILTANLCTATLHPTPNNFNR